MALRESHLTDVESFESTIAEPRSTDESTGQQDRATELAYLQQTPPAVVSPGQVVGILGKVRPPSPRGLSWKFDCLPKSLQSPQKHPRFSEFAWLINRHRGMDYAERDLF